MLLPRLLLLTLLAALWLTGAQVQSPFFCQKQEDEDGVACWFISRGQHVRPVVFPRKTLEDFPGFFRASRAYLCAFISPCALTAFDQLFVEVNGVLLHLPEGAALIHSFSVGFNLLFHRLRNVAMDNSISEDAGVRRRTTFPTFIMDDVRWSLNASITIVFSHEEACFDLQCLQRYATSLALRTLPKVKADLPSLALYLTEVRFAFAFAGSAEISQHLASACSIVQNGLHLEDSHSTFIVYCNSYIVPAPANGEVMYFDAREQIAREAHASHPTTYYLFVDNRVRIDSPSWLLASILPLLEDRAADMPGVAFLGKEWVKSLSGVHDEGSPTEFDASALLSYPSNPILHESFFDLFPTALFLNPVHPTLNNFLLMDIYRSTQSLSSYNYLSALTALEGHLLMNFNLWMEAYRLHLETARRRYLSAVNRLYYPKNPLPGIPRSGEEEESASSLRVYLGLQAGDVLWRHYCTHWLGDCSEARPTLHSWTEEPSASPQVEEASVMDWQGDAQDAVPSPAASTERYAFLYSQRGARVAVITAVLGRYEASCKPFARQTLPTDFFCFTDNDQLVNAQRGWIVDRTPYHRLLWQDEDRDALLAAQTNSLHNNRHPFNTAKFYKLHFPRIPRLQGYAHVVWVDATGRIVDRFLSERLVDLVQRHGETADIVSWRHVQRASLRDEVEASVLSNKYTVTAWGGHAQPFQDVRKQLQVYREKFPALDDNYREEEEKVWCTCFVAYRMASPVVAAFLREWGGEVARHTTQDQVSFPAVARALNYTPYTLPDENITGSFDLNTFFIKLPHNL